LAGLHIARVVADKAKEQGFRKVALLGTKWTMEGPSYLAAFGPEGIEIAAPEKADRELINRVIFEELCQGRVLPESQNAFVKIISQMAASGCDAVALSCTEIPLLVTKEVSPLPILDSTRLLAQEAVKVALGEKPLPTWRGGPAS
jgi:aspartate racemase